MQLVKDLFRGLTYREISTELKQQYPYIIHGLSERSIRRFVKYNNLRGAVVCQSIAEVRSNDIQACASSGTCFLG